MYVAISNQRATDWKRGCFVSVAKHRHIALSWSVQASGVYWWRDRGALVLCRGAPGLSPEGQGSAANCAGWRRKLAAFRVSPPGYSPIPLLNSYRHSAAWPLWILHLFTPANTSRDHGWDWSDWIASSSSLCTKQRLWCFEFANTILTATSTLSFYWKLHQLCMNNNWASQSVKSDTLGENWPSSHLFCCLIRKTSIFLKFRGCMWLAEMTWPPRISLAMESRNKTISHSSPFWWSHSCI